ncbi:MAG: alkaline phosphatase family protein [Myxococcales bacterium]|nr:alkaline phosphatase family protein [Myxococcales bacterium]
MLSLCLLFHTSGLQADQPPQQTRPSISSEALRTARAGTAATAAAPRALPRRARYVLIVSEDGMHPALIREQPLPNHERLYKNGAYSFRARTISTASTLPSHASMLSGVDSHEHGLRWNNWRPERGYIRAPTVFSLATQEGLSTSAIVGKFKLRHILPQGTVETFVRPGYYCRKVSEEAARRIEADQPTLMFVHFSDPDEKGHSAGWLSDAQRAAARECDRCLGTLLEALDRRGTLHETLIIVSADHGGHSHGHSGILLSDLQIPWIAHGPKVRRGYAISGRVSTMDTAATVLFALGLQAPTNLRGRPVHEIFARSGEAEARP